MVYLIVLAVLVVAIAIVLRRHRTPRIPFGDLTREEQTALLENARGQAARAGQRDGFKSPADLNHVRNNSPWG